MRLIAFGMIAVGTLAGLAYSCPTSGQADKEASPIYEIKTYLCPLIRPARGSSREIKAQAHRPPLLAIPGYIAVLSRISRAAPDLRA